MLDLFVAKIEADREYSFPPTIIQSLVKAFDAADISTLVGLYAGHAVNHQVAEFLVEGRDAILEMFQREFSNSEMVCFAEDLFEDGEWAILEWRDPPGLRGGGFFHLRNG